MAEATVSDKFAQVMGFSVEISGSSGKEIDNAWKSVSGGELIIEMTETTIGGDKFKTNSPGHKSVGEVTLRGDMTDGRKAMCEWINKTVQSNKDWKRNLTITELLSSDGGVKPGKKYNYYDGFPTCYVFPKMSVTNTTGNVEEEVRLKFVRFEMQ